MELRLFLPSRIIFIGHHHDVTYASQHLKSVATSLYTQRLIQTNIK